MYELRNRDRIVENGVWLYILQLFNTVLPLATIPYITRILGPSGYGFFSYALNVVGYSQVVVEYGFGMSATRKVAIGPEDSEGELNMLFSAVVYSRLFLWSAVSICLAVYSLLSKIQLMSNICIWILHMGMIGYCFQQNWLFQGKQNMKYISVIGMVSRITSVVLVFLLVTDKDDVVIYCVLYSVTPIVIGAIGTVVAVLRFEVRFVRVSLNRMIEELKSGWNIFCTQFNSKIFNNIGITLLGIMYSAYEVGIYSAIHKIPNVLFLCWSPINQVLYPIFSREVSSSYSSGKKQVFKIQRKALVFFSVLVATLAVSARFLVSLLFGMEYIDYYYLVFPLLIWVLIGINNNFWGIQLMLGGGYDKEYRRCFNKSVVCTIIINICLVSRYGMLGAAWSPLLSEIVLSIMLYFGIKRIEAEMSKGI